MIKFIRAAKERLRRLEQSLKWGKRRTAHKYLRSRIARKYLRRRFRDHVGKYPRIACYAADGITISIMLDGWQDRRELEFLALRVFPQLKGRATCLDIGANIGNHALFFARHFDEVIAFEPNPETCRLLRFNAELADNVVVINQGCSNIRRTARAIQPLTHLSCASIAEISGGGGGRTPYKTKGCGVRAEPFGRDGEGLRLHRFHEGRCGGARAGMF